MKSRRPVMGAVLGAVLAAVVFAIAAASAQTPTQDSGAAPSLSLSPAQRQAIYQSVSKTQKNNAAPIGFRASVGAPVPAGIELTPLSDTLAKLVPQARDYEIAMIEKQVVLVDPKTKQVVAVVTQEPGEEQR
jgi:hypothetical protein